MLLSAAYCANAMAVTPLQADSFEVLGRSIIAFVPPTLKNSEDEGAIEGVAHLRFAVEDTYKCLQPMQIAVKFLYADQVSLRNGANSQVVQVHLLGQAVGAILVEPGRSAETVFSVNGPSTLQFLLPQAASKYWQVKACNP
jgi:hypothetical protein